MMMNSSCIGGCLDAQSPVEKRSVRLYRWAQGDKEFLRQLLSMNKETEQNASSTASWAITTPSSSPTPSPARLVPTGGCDQNYACRQRYLRSYTFTKKQTAGQRTKKWLQQQHGGLKAKSSSATRTCSFLDAVFKLLFVCVAKVDVHEI